MIFKFSKQIIRAFLKKSKEIMQNAFSRLWMKQVVNLSIFFMSVSSELQSSVFCVLFGKMFTIIY